ncbi:MULTISPECIES: nucleotidyltransferase domain-containing protein [unclassified Carboxylicivirga]|uniref:nucleotidyltransferase domain-containing protein n=1 Tax=Carboxylicivirga TaxID=1628153 RepID=UPI003D350FD8
MIKNYELKDLKQAIYLSSIRNTPLQIMNPVSDEVVALCNDNGLSAWCYSRYKDDLLRGLDPAVVSQWKSIYFLNTISYQRYLVVFNKVNQLLRQAGIPLLVLKGMALASSLYGDDGLRPMGDIDVLVPDGMGLKALDILLKSGAKQLFVPRSSYHEQADAHVRAVSIDGIMVEVHQRLFALGSNFHTSRVDFFKHRVVVLKQNTQMQMLNDVWMGYHLIAHAIKGIEMGGLRLGWLLDIAVLINAQKDYKTYIDSILSVRPKMKNAMLSVVNMAALLLPEHDLYNGIDIDLNCEKIFPLLNNDGHEKVHRWINLHHHIRTPGLTNKAHLLFYEFFPCREYMLFRYQASSKAGLLYAYLKRITGR